MKRKRIIGAVVALLAIAVGVWWVMQPAPAPVKIANLVQQDLLGQDGDVLCATAQGRLVLNAVIAALLN